MRHTLQVIANPSPPTIRFAELRKRRVAPWLWHMLFGSRRIVILVPGDTVDEVIITENPARNGR